MVTEAIGHWRRKTPTKILSLQIAVHVSDTHLVFGSEHIALDIRHFDCGFAGGNCTVTRKEIVVCSNEDRQEVNLSLRSHVSPRRAHSVLGNALNIALGWTKALRIGFGRRAGISLKCRHALTVRGKGQRISRNSWRRRSSDVPMRPSLLEPAFSADDSDVIVRDAERVELDENKV